LAERSERRTGSEKTKKGRAIGVRVRQPKGNKLGVLKTVFVLMERQLKDPDGERYKLNRQSTNDQELILRPKTPQLDQRGKNSNPPAYPTDGQRRDGGGKEDGIAAPSRWSAPTDEGRETVGRVLKQRSQTGTRKFGGRRRTDLESSEEPVSAAVSVGRIEENCQT